MSLSSCPNAAEAFQVAAFYAFTSLAERQIAPLLAELPCVAGRHQVKGTVLLAEEGVNGTICGPADGVQDLLAQLQCGIELSLVVKISWSSRQAFRRFKARRKQEIVSMGVPGIDPLETVGIYIDPAEWNELIDDPDTLVIDTRNDYEVAIGQFEGAINPCTETFRSFPDWVEMQLKPMVTKCSPQRIAMYCTGGIRCEKATALLLQEGFTDVHHLNGGILRYLEEMPEADSRWRGECFVFDQRVSVNHQLQPGVHKLCHACGLPLTPEDVSLPTYRPGIQCRHCVERFTDQDRQRFAERQRQLQAQRSREPQAEADSLSPLA
ncbi:MAG: rhodanese-related sulfurtransferase [Prochlorococcus sp.]